MAQNERQTIWQNSREFAVSDLRIQQIDASGVDLDQDVILARLPVWHIADPHAVGASATIEENAFIAVVSR
jgi:hypothetical protein